MSEPLTFQQLWDANAKIQPRDENHPRYIIHPAQLEYVKRCHGDPVKRSELMRSISGNPDLGWIGLVMWQIDEDLDNDRT